MKLQELVTKEYENVEETVSTQQAVIHSSVNELLETFKLWNLAIQNYNADNFDPFSYRSALQRIGKSNIPYKSEDITQFLTTVSQSKSENDIINVGIFVSALINIHHRKKSQKRKEKNTYLLITEDFKQEIDFLCYENNGATIHIEGNVGNYFCNEMKEGNITINGKCGPNAGTYMEGGILTLQEADDNLGANLKGGVIYVKKARERIGGFMRGGTIHISEYYKSLSSLRNFGGKIFFKDKEITYEEKEEGIQ